MQRIPFRHPHRTGRQPTQRDVASGSFSTVHSIGTVGPQFELLERGGAQQSFHLAAVKDVGPGLQLFSDALECIESLGTVGKVMPEMEHVDHRIVACVGTLESVANVKPARQPHGSVDVGRDRRVDGVETRGIDQIGVKR